ncbi:glycosyltransferase [Flavobacterium sp.]|jgi:glycosyltransferase involved in cell wall biosynthesis|uniref:glycosyltransferase n=1 Tax=Flavobacterium sp. TaxID=239 RepID=UPI0022C11D60|nr:glycosyltransferase [Flavobacterium sp.]MCZ8230040.1 glycosyltransferase [Flavobacterium sp.]
MKFKKKSVHIITGLGQGGAESILSKLVVKLKDENADYKQIVISLTSLDYHTEKIRLSGVEVHHVNMKGLLDLKSFHRLYKLVKKINPDVVFTWMYHANLIGGFVSKFFFRKKVIWNIHHAYVDSDSLRFPTRVIAYLCSFFSYLIPEKIIFCSSKGLINHCKIYYSKSKCIVVYNGYDENIYKPNKDQRSNLRNKFGVNDNELIIGLVARWHPVKDHYNFIDAIDIVLNKCQSNFRIIMVGEGVDESNLELVNYLKKSNLLDSFILYGMSDNVSEIYNMIDINVLSSKAEAFPNSLAESMLCGTPCVSTNVGDASVIIDKFGWVCNPLNSLDLSNSIIKSIEFIKLNGKDNIGALSRDFVSKKFNSKIMLDQFNALLKVD